MPVLKRTNNCNLMQEPKDNLNDKRKKLEIKGVKTNENTHLGSSNAFEETENPLSRDPDNISDEKLDELLDE
jgi:hypothetical protein